MDTSTHSSSGHDDYSIFTLAPLTLGLTTDLDSNLEAFPWNLATLRPRNDISHRNGFGASNELSDEAKPSMLTLIRTPITSGPWSSLFVFILSFLLLNFSLI
jgi:hypothetical protein